MVFFINKFILNALSNRGFFLSASCVCLVIFISNLSTEHAAEGIFFYSAKYHSNEDFERDILVTEVIKNL